MDESDNVVRFPNGKISDTALSKAKQVQKQDNVLNMDRYEKKVEEQVNGSNKVTVTKKKDNIVAMDDYRVNPVHKVTNTGSSTSYGAGCQNNYYVEPNRREHNINRINMLKDKKSRGTITVKELKELNELDPNSIDLF